jgi:hypothetical protein
LREQVVEGGENVGGEVGAHGCILAH